MVLLLVIYFLIKKKIHAFPLSITVSEFLNQLETENILSAPIMNENQNVVGIVDVLDIVLFVIGLFPKNMPLDNLDENELRTIMATGGKFDSTPISHVLELSNGIKRGYKHLFTVQKSTPINKLLEMFYQGVHRVLVIGEEKERRLESIVSQSDLLSLLAQCLPYLEDSEKKKTIVQLKLFDKSSLRTVSADTKTISVLSKHMQPNIDLPIFSAVPIIDNDGNLVANFSASNLKGLRQTSFIALLLPVLAYLTIQPESADFRKNLARFKSIHPVTCTENTPFDVVVERMVAHRVHRLWVVQDNKPIGVISIGDVFKVFLPWTHSST